MNILEKIIREKRPDIEKLKHFVPVKELEKSEFFERETFSLPEYILVKSPGIIAEFKRKSPSRSDINLNADLQTITLGYQQAGASALSVLTDEKFFGGNKNDILSIRKKIKIPVLRKDFIFDEYQVIEAKSIGADAILLIAAVLSKQEIKNLSVLAKSLDLSVLMEVHNEKELDKLCMELDVVGVNNRNLKTFEVSLDASLDLVDKIPAEFVKISESGIKNTEDIEILRQAGFQGFLIGESFMKEKNPASQLEQWIKDLNS